MILTENTFIIIRCDDCLDISHNNISISKNKYDDSVHWTLQRPIPIDLNFGDTIDIIVKNGDNEMAKMQLVFNCLLCGGINIVYTIIYALILTIIFYVLNKMNSSYVIRYYIFILFRY